MCRLSVVSLLVLVALLVAVSSAHRHREIFIRKDGDFVVSSRRERVRSEVPPPPKRQRLTRRRQWTPRALPDAPMNPGLWSLVPAPARPFNE